MADRNLTFEDFKRLPPEERSRRYEELSDHEVSGTLFAAVGRPWCAVQYLYPSKADMLQGVSGWYPGRAYE